MPEPSPIAPASTQDIGALTPEMMSLLGTLLSGQYSGLSQAELDQQQAQVHQQASDAAQASDQAAQAYTDQTNQPQEQPNNFYDQLLGNTASVLSGNKDYSHQASERLAQHGRELDAARMQNLQSLKAAAENKAQIAEKLGNAEVVAQSRKSIEQYHAKMKQISEAARQLHEDKALNTKGGQDKDLETQRQKGRMELQKLRGLQAVDIAKLRAEGKNISPEDESWISQAVTTTSTGYKVLNTSGLTGNSKNKAIQWGLANGMPALDAANMKVLEDIQGARDNIDDILSDITDKLPTDPVSRALGTPGIQLSRVFQSDADRASFASWRTAAIKNLRATAGSGGLRINQKEIELAVANDIPRITDTVETALKKMNNIRIMLDNAERPLATHDWRRPGSAAAKAESVANPKPSGKKINYKIVNGQMVPQ